jgi:signal transduction histidine kinase
MAQETQQLTFSIDNRLLEELGENLVRRNHVALAELIKNAYDADSTEVTLKFINSRQKEDRESEIQVIDNGVGMTPEEIQQNWMRIATTDKVRNPTSDEYGREKTGEKGIGRFACRRLANRLELVSVAEAEDVDGYVRTTVKFGWEEFQRDEDLDSVPVPANVEPLEEGEVDNTGVTLRLIDLRDKWNQQDFNTLRRNVITLSVVQPQKRGEDYKEDPGFEINFDAPEFEKGEGTLLEQFHEAGWGCLEGEITEQGDVKLSLDAKLIGQQEYTLSKKVEGLENTNFKISHIPRNKKEHFRDAQTLSLQRAREILDEQSGIRVYKGGFRVYPYGGPDDDWLGLGRRYQQRDRAPDEEFEALANNLELHTSFERVNLVHPGNRNLIGRVDLDGEVDLTMKASREGFIENETFSDLKEVLLLSLQWLTLQYSHYKEKKSKKEMEEEVSKLEDQVSVGEDGEDEAEETEDEEESGKEEDEGEVSTDSSGDDPVDQAISVLEHASETAIESSSEDDDEPEVSEDVVDTATDVIKSSIERQEREIDFLRSAFSVNQLVFGFSHELRSMINQLDSNAKHIENAMEDIPDEHRDRFQEIADGLRDMRSRFEEQLNLFGIFMESGDEKQEQPNPVEPIVDDVINGGQYILDDHNIEASNEVPAVLETPSMYESEVYSIVINLFTNSLKAVIAGSGNRKEISIGAEETDDGIRIRVSDTGIGIPKGQREQVFQPLISDPSGTLYDRLNESISDEVSEELGSGTGLGLSIVQDIAEQHDGEARFIDVDDWETCVEVTLNE